MESYLQNILEISTKITTPLMLGGLVILVLFLIFRQILKIFAGSGDRVSGKDTVGIIRKIINVFLVIAVISIVLGFIGYVLPSVLKAVYPPLDPDYVDVETDVDKPFEILVAEVALGRDVTINICENCPESVRKAVVSEGNHGGKNIKSVLEGFKDRVKGPDINYAVEEKGGKRYEISCQP